MQFTLIFDARGTGHGFYTEIIDLAAIGALEIHRANHVEFNNISQAWEVRDMTGEILFVHALRQACLHWEQQQYIKFKQPYLSTTPTQKYP